ncbi:MAG: nucleotide pyrophosphohydrolase [Candidatus Roizmanbacteria bacterium]|nr:nucleotide pyrophosphohydrolase [Candidatus Roizmanbacteria bacterium]
MDLKQLTAKAKEVKELYSKHNEKSGEKTWSNAEYAQGLVGDVGDLVKLLMAKNNFRHYDNLDEKIAHELSDCLWSILVIADDLKVDLEPEFANTMNELKKRITDNM